MTADEKIAALTLLLADPIEILNTASDEICPRFLTYLIDHSVTDDVLVEVVRVLADVHG